MHTTPTDSVPVPIEFGRREWAGIWTLILTAIGVPSLAIFGWAWQLNTRISVLENIVYRQVTLLEEFDKQERADAFLEGQNLQKIEDILRRLAVMENRNLRTEAK